MPKITNSTTFEGIEIVTIEYDDGSGWSGLKSAYGERLVQAEHFTPIDTLPSKLAVASDASTVK